MAAAPPPPASTAAPSRRRWLRRFAVGLGILLLVLAVFHRPLGHWALGYFGAGALERAGLTGTWKTSGNLFSGLQIEDVRLKGSAESKVQSVSMRHADLNYDLMALRGGGVGRVLKRLVVQDLEVEMDLTRPGVRKEPKPSKGKPKLPDVYLPEIRIEHVSLRMKRESGLMEVVDFSLILDPAKPGEIQAARLDLPGVPRLQNIRGVTRMEPRKLILEGVVLAPELVIDRMVLDLAGLANNQAGLELSARQGEARVALRGSSADWFTAPAVDMELETRRISHGTLAWWGLPAGPVEWLAPRMDLKVKGPVLRPDQLAGEVRLEGGRLKLEEREAAPIMLQAAWSSGRFDLQALTVEQGANRATATGGAALPDQWKGIARVAGHLDYKLEVPQLAGLMPPEVEVQGQAEGSGRVAFADAALSSASAKVNAVRLGIHGVPVEALRAEIGLADQLVTLEALDVRLNGENRLNLKGTMEVAVPRRFAVEWAVEAPDLSEIPVEVQADPFWPSEGRVSMQGKAAGLLAELLKADFTSIDGQAATDVTGLKFREARLDSLRLEAAAAAGTVTVNQLSVRLDADNRLEFSGTMDLQDEAFPVSAGLDVRIPEVSKVTPWSSAFGGPVFTGGQAFLEWRGTGTIDPLQMGSRGDLRVEGLRIEGMPEVLGVTGVVEQSGSNLQVSGLNATAGPWRAVGDLSWDGWHLEVPGLELFAGEKKLAGLSARVPWHDGAIPPDSPFLMELKVDRLEAGKLSDALGRPLPVEGILEVDGRFEGTLRNPGGALSVKATQVRPNKPAGEVKLDSASLDVSADLKDGQLQLEGTVTQRPLAPLSLSASVPLDLVALTAEPETWKSLPVQAEVKLPSSSLAFLPTWVPAVRQVRGTASADLTLSGTLGNPAWQGNARVEASQALFTSVALPTVKDLNLSLRGDESRLRITQGSVMLAGGTLRVEGEVGLADLAAPLLDLRVRAQEILVVRDENLTLRADADITCAGPLAAAAVTGNIFLVRGRVLKEIEFLPLSLPNDLPPPPPATTVARQGAPALPAPLDQWTFDVVIRTRDPIRLLGNVARGNAIADLRLTGKGEAPVLVGNVRLEDMWVRLPFSRLNVTDGALTFVRESPFDPQIDVTAESIVGDRMVQVFVQGRALDPKVRLTSSPPLPEGEIASLLATGVTTSDLSSGGEEVAGRAAYVVLRQAYRKMFGKSPLVDNDDEPPRLTFDFSMFGSDPEKRGVSAIYELNPNWRMIGRVGETGTFRGMLQYLIRFR